MNTRESVPQIVGSEPLASSTIPRISIVTPSFNQGKYLEKTILSVLEQGYPNLEYIIIDGGSSDESVEIIKKYEDRLAYWVSEPDRGQSHAINKGFARATGCILGWLNSDDWYRPGALKAVVEAFAANPDVGAVVGAGEMTDGTHTVLRTPVDVSVETLYKWVDYFFMQPSCFFTRKAWMNCGPVDESLDFAMDLDLWIRIAREWPCATTRETLSTSLVHPNAKTTEFACASISEVVKVIATHGGLQESLKLTSNFIEELYEKRHLLTESQGRIVQLDNTILTRNNEIAERDRWIAERDRWIAERNQEIASLRGSVSTMTQTIDALHNSASWKLTKPLRWLCTKMNELRRGMIQ